MIEVDNKSIIKKDVEKTRKALEAFENTCPELFVNGNLKLFHYFYCPISIAEITVEEYIREEYDSLELLILKIYDSGITTVDSINHITGLGEKIIRKIINIEKNVYNHISEEGITDLGRQSIKDGINHVIYEIKKEIQFEGITHTVLDKEIEQVADRLISIRNESIDSMFPNRILFISDSIKKEISERLVEYKKNEKSVIDKNYKSILNIETKVMRYANAYVVLFDYLPDPFIILGGHNYKRKKGYTQLWKPTAISENNANALKSKNVDLSDYNIRDNIYFVELKEKMSEFSYNTEEIDVLLGLDGSNMEMDNNKIKGHKCKS